MTRATRVSFIIPHYGREEMLQQTIRSIAEQQLDTVSVELILVTMNMTLNAATENILDKIPNRVIQAKETDTISKMRNDGFRASEGAYIAFLDADVYIAPNWLEQMIGLLHQDDSLVMVSAIQACSDDAPILEKIRTALSNVHIDCDMQFLPGRNLFMRREVFERVSGFPEHLITCEDYYFTQKVAEIGRLYYSSSSSYVHLGEDKDYYGMFKKEIWRGQSNIHSLKGRKVPLSEIPSFLVPIWVLIFIVCIPIALTVDVAIALASLLLALLPIGLYSLRLYKKSRLPVGFYSIVRFYAFYFPARCLGTIFGLFKILKV